ncbi:MAG: AIPR family protein [Desulfitobacteriaceae bacterium]
MNIAKQLVDNQIINLINDYPEYFTDVNDEERKRSKAFLLIAVASYLEMDISNATQYLTDGGDDGGFDAAYIASGEESQLNVILFQTKYTRDLNKDSNFSANAIEKAVNTIKGVFDPQKQMRLNEGSRAVVTDIHSHLLDGYIPVVTFVCINNGLKWDSSAQNYIDNNFGGQKQVEFEYFNHEDIIKRSNKTKGISTSIQLKGKAIREDFNYKSVILGRTSVSEIFKLMKEHGDALLEKNIRKYLGRNVVNEEIRKTLLHDDKRNNFFFFNNGITIVCEKFGANFLQESNWIVKVDKMQIINGGQTCKTIFQTIRDHSEIDFTNVEVLVRIYEVNNDENVIRDITFATNSQNPVDFRDQKSNDPEQKLLEQGAEGLHYIYKRKRDSQTTNQAGTDIILSSVAAEAVLAVWRDRPHIAKYKKYEFFNTYYETIFKDLNAAQMIIAVLIFRFCDNYRRKISSDPKIQAQRKYSQYFMSMLMGQQLLLQLNITLDQLTHRNFEEVRKLFDQIKEPLYSACENYMVDCLHDKLRYLNCSLNEIDGRTIAAIFRRFDIIQNLKNAPKLL